jgi:hypothetical protein
MFHTTTLREAGHQPPGASKRDHTSSNLHHGYRSAAAIAVYIEPASLLTTGRH